MCLEASARALTLFRTLTFNTTMYFPSFLSVSLSLSLPVLQQESTLSLSHSFSYSLVSECKFLAPSSHRLLFLPFSQFLLTPFLLINRFPSPLGNPSLFLFFFLPRYFPLFELLDFLPTMHICLSNDCTTDTFHPRLDFFFWYSILQVTCLLCKYTSTEMANNSPILR